MDYYLIGQRIRKFRKACMLSQEELAEKVGISTTHMSHIETGNTKLSLPVIVAIASALHVNVDDLLSEKPEKGKCHVEESLSLQLEGTTANERRIVLDILRTTIDSLQRNRL